MTEIPSEDRTMAMLAHLSMILLGVIGPLIFWLIGKDKSEFQKDQTTEALNFSIIGTIASIVTCGIAFIAVIIFAIIGGLAANKGEAYRYPINWRIVK
ncbi:MAG: DUF4870 domain-containing protein [Actinobacteria bacterium HGW-Actinobacteria-4]|nr:MAG: DUF4870 domain-containing protein [Actinobacteria bacterium HGW-Actinobacteria-4]